MKAFISDIHANFEALCAVFEDIDRHAVESIVCLGDIVGYGPDPEACTDFVMEKASVCIMGNHDHALIHGPLGFNPIAADMIRITQTIMSPRQGEGEEVRGERFFPCVRSGGEAPPCLVMRHTSTVRWSYIENLPQTHHEGPALLVHGSVLDPIYEYVFPDSVHGLWNPMRLAEMFGKIPRLSLCGHTHVPCAISSELRCHYPQRDGAGFVFDNDEKYIINVGSVGQPRDGDSRACYLLFDEAANAVEWRRIPYDTEAVVKKIEGICGPGNWCGARLRLGK